MSQPHQIQERHAAEHIHGICLKNGPPERVGVELEWLVRDTRDPSLPVSAERIATAVSAFGAGDAGEAPPDVRLPSSASPGVLPSGALLTTEPGGQLELSSLPADTLADCVRVTAADVAALRAATAEAGLELAGYGLDPYRSPRRILHLPRYAAMEAFFDRDGPWGRQMMGATASVQVCLDAGDDSAGPSGYRWRWRLLHAIGPVLVAAFANSPLRGGKPTGWRSSRQQVWAHMDPGRTRPPRLDDDPRAAWAAYALDANVMCLRSDGSADWSAPHGLTLRDWVRGADGLRAPTEDDLAYHLSTLFPPVRPHGYLELRMIDAQPGDGWVVPLAVATALADDAQAGDAAMAAAERLWDGAAAPGDWPPGPAGADPDVNPWLAAARCGPADPRIARASRECFAAARDALARRRTPETILAAVDDFIEQYVQKDRCPSDDLLEEAR
jgi:ergothioneine biosynthesis glutamate--cysteine ligase EgtA